MCVCIDGGWGERWLGGLLFFLRSSGSDGRRVIEGVLNFMGLECAGESCLACLACFAGTFVWKAVRRRLCGSFIILSEKWN